MTATVVSKKLRLTQGYISEVEHGRTKFAKDRLASLCKFYEFEPDEVDELATLRVQGTQRAWWHYYSAVFDGEVLRFFGYEHGAETIHTDDGGLIPSLLQTREYAEAVMIGGGPNLRMAEVGKRLEARMIRQKLLDGDHPVRLTAVINKAALHQQVGGRENPAAPHLSFATVAWSTFLTEPAK